MTALTLATVLLGVLALWALWAAWCYHCATQDLSLAKVHLEIIIAVWKEERARQVKAVTLLYLSEMRDLTTPGPDQAAALARLHQAHLN